MTEQHQIEEMAKVIGNTWLVDLEGDTKDVCEVLDEVDIKGIARELYEQSYRKIPKDSVVLSREEQERILTATEKRIKELKRQILQARKETAEKILNELLDFVNGWFEGVENNDFGVEFNRMSKDFAEKYGVKIKG